MGIVMSNLEANKKTCLKFFELATSGQFDAARALLHDDVTWWILGDLPTSGTHAGPEAVINLFGMLGQFLAPPIKLNFTELTAEEDRVAVEMNGDCKFVDGTPYRTFYHLLFRIKDGKIFSGREYFDTKYVSEVFSMQEVAA